MSFKRAVTFQKDASGDTDHGERLSGQKYWKLPKLGRIYCWGSQKKTWNSTFHFLTSRHSISDITFEPFDIFQQIDCPRTCLCETQLSWKFERNRGKFFFWVDGQKMKRGTGTRFIFSRSTKIFFLQFRSNVQESCVSPRQVRGQSICWKISNGSKVRYEILWLEAKKWNVEFYVLFFGIPNSKSSLTFEVFNIFDRSNALRDQYRQAHLSAKLQRV